MKNFCLYRFAAALVSAVVLLVSSGLQPLMAQKHSEVTGLAFQGKTVRSARVTVLPPGNAGNKTEAAVGDRYVSGTRLTIPPNTIIQLKSPGGTQVVKSTIQGNAMQYTIEFTAKGENHVTKGLGAQIANTVHKAVGYNYRNTNEKGTTAASKGTRFTFTDYSDGKSKKAVISTEEGSIQIIDKVPIHIQGATLKPKRHGDELSKSNSVVQSAGQGAFTSSNAAVEYSNYQEAIAALQQELSDDAAPDELAEDYLGLGELFMEMERPLDAVPAFRYAMQYFETEYGSDDMSTLESALSLAEALLSTGNAKDEQEGSALLENSIQLLLEELEMQEDDLTFARQEDDGETVHLLCEDLVEVYAFLGWAYDVAGDEGKSTVYYTKSEKDCR
ncbi:MAG: tetratricopeptide repeat protein [Bacteroidetes bacterium]|nr:tetratricopeptide repeat protein [Bacteroidota bacterium]